MIYRAVFISEFKSPHVVFDNIWSGLRTNYVRAMSDLQTHTHSPWTEFLYRWYIFQGPLPQRFEVVYQPIYYVYLQTQKLIATKTNADTLGAILHINIPYLIGQNTYHQSGQKMCLISYI